MPDANIRGHVRNEVISQVFTGINKSGTAEDLTNIQRFLNFGRKKFGDKSGASIVNEVFDNPDAYRKMQELSSALETSQAAEAAGKVSPFRAWWDETAGGTGRLAISAILPAAGSVIGANMGGHGIIGALAGAAPKTGTAGLKLVFKVSPEVVGRWISGRSKIPDILVDLVEGNTHKYPTAMIAQILGQIRRSAEEETQTQ
jgi:hypothetical protein